VHQDGPSESPTRTGRGPSPSSRRPHPDRTFRATSGVFGSGPALAGLGEVVDAGPELGHPVTLLLPAVSLPPAVFLELGAVVLHPLIGPGPELVGVAGALLGDLGPAPHISSPGRRHGRSAGGRLGPVGLLLRLHPRRTRRLLG